MHYNCSVRSYTLATSETWMNSLYSIAVRLLDFDQSTVFFVGNSSFTPRKLQFHTQETLVSYLGNSSFMPKKLQFHPVWNFSFTQVVLIVSSFLQNDLPDAPSKSFHWTAITIYNASALENTNFQSPLRKSATLRWRSFVFHGDGI